MLTLARDRQFAASKQLWAVGTLAVPLLIIAAVELGRANKASQHDRLSARHMA